MVYDPTHRIYTADWETGDGSQWDVIQNVSFNDTASGYTFDHYSCTLVTSVTRQGTYAARFELRDGDIPFGGTERTEAQAPLYTSGGQEGDDRWYQFSVQFGGDFPDDHASQSWGLVAQWHDESAGSPPVGFYVDTSDGHWGLRINQQSSPGVFIDSHILWETPLAQGTWHDIVIHILWSTDDDIGLVELWHQGERVTFTGGPDAGDTTTTIRTLVPGGGGTYFKCGYYRDADVAGTGVVYHDWYAVADDPTGLDLLTPDGGGSSLVAAVDDHDRAPLCRVLVDWDRDGSYDHALSDITSWVTDLTIERSLTGELPVEATLVEGSMAATLTATLGGIDPNTGLEAVGSDGLSAVEVFAPWRADSPLYGAATLGCGVRAELGFATDDGPQLVRQFTGHIRSLEPDSGERSVTLSAIDLTDRLHAAVTLPDYSLDRTNVLVNGHRALVNTQAVVDYVLRRNGIYASPPARDDAQISCTGHGWYAAEAGRSAVPQGVCNTITDASWWTDGPFDMLASRGLWESGHGMYQEFFSREECRPVAGRGVGFGCWVRLHDGFDDSSASRTLIEMMPLLDHDAFRYRVSITGAGRIGGYLYSDAGGQVGAATSPATSTPTWTYVGVHWQHKADGTTRISFRLNGATGFTNVTTPALTSTIAPRLQATMWTYVDWACMQVWFEEEAPPGVWPGEVHTPQATLGRGLAELTFVPDVLGADSLEVIKEAVAGEFGVFTVDEFGYPVFRNREAALETTVDKEVTADRSLLDLASTVSIDGIRNVISTETTYGFLAYPSVIAESRDVEDYQSPVGVTVHDVQLPHGAVGWTTMTLPMVPDGSWSADTTWGFVAVRADAPSTLLSSNISVTFAMIGPRQGQLTVRNYTGSPVRFATTSGSPALRVAGWLLVKEPAVIEEVRAEGSIDLYGERVYKIPASDWRQVPAQLRTISGGLLATLAHPMPVVAEIPITGDPNLHLGDLIRFVDPQGLGMFRGYLVGLRQHLGAGGFTSELTVRVVGSPGYGVWGDPELGVWGDTLVWAP